MSAKPPRGTQGNPTERQRAGKLLAAQVCPGCQGKGCKTCGDTGEAGEKPKDG